MKDEVREERKRQKGGYALVTTTEVKDQEERAYAGQGLEVDLEA